MAGLALLGNPPLALLPCLSVFAARSAEPMEEVKSKFVTLPAVLPCFLHFRLTRCTCHGQGCILALRLRFVRWHKRPSDAEHERFLSFAR